MRAVSVARRSAVKAKTQAINQLRALLVSAPQEIRDRLLKVKTAECIEVSARLRSLGKTPMLQTLTTTLRLLAKRWLTLAQELKARDSMLDMPDQPACQTASRKIWRRSADRCSIGCCSGRQSRTPEKRSCAG